MLGCGNKKRTRSKLAVVLWCSFGFKKAAAAKEGKKQWRNKLRHLAWAYKC